MENDEILIKYQESYSKAYKWAKRIFLVAGATIILQLGSDIATVTNNKKLYNTPKYSCIAALTAGFEEEKKKLGLEDKTMYLEIVSDSKDSKFVGECQWDPNDDYTIRIGYDYMTKGVLKHEMFHAKRIKEGKIKPSRLRLILQTNYEEWLATSYALKKEN